MDRRDKFASGDFWQQCFLLCFATGAIYRVGHHHRPNEGRRQDDAAHLFEHEHQIDVAECRAAICFGNHEAEPSEFGNLLPQLGLIAALLFHQAAHECRGAFFFEQIARALAQHFLLFAESEIHVCRPFPVLRS